MLTFQTFFVEGTRRPPAYIGLRKVDSVLAVGIWVGLGPELGSKKQSENKQKLIFYAFYKPDLTIIKRDMSACYS